MSSARRRIRDKDMSKQLRALEHNGYTVARLGNGHIQVRDPDGKRVAWVSVTSVNRRQQNAFRTALNRAARGRQA